MKTDKTKLLQDIEAMKEKLAEMEEHLNKPEVFKHFPSKYDRYYYYTSSGAICSNEASSDNLKVNSYKTKKEAEKAYNKAVALEKVKRRIIELQGDWKPNWTDDDEEKHFIQYDHYKRSFLPTFVYTTKQDTTILYMKREQIAKLIIYELEDELKLIFDIA